jgi:hypothetical protein
MFIHTILPVIKSTTPIPSELVQNEMIMKTGHRFFIVLRTQMDSIIMIRKYLNHILGLFDKFFHQQKIMY